MKISIHNLVGYKLEAKDGEFGRTEDFYFDDISWEIRYLIAKTGNWLTGRKVLISPISILGTDSENEVFRMDLTREQIKNSPDIDTDKPVSRQQELELHGFYLWQPYWRSELYARGGIWNTLTPAYQADEEKPEALDFKTKQEADDVHLRSIKNVSDYHIHAIDGDIGHVKDFIIDDQTWQMTDLVIDTHNWTGGKKVIIPVHHITEIQWDNFKIIMDIPVAFIEECALFNEEEYKHQ